ncbi:oxidoreductase, Gfo/Idh/MocA family domain protein [Burkholderia pseudomallei A79D]|nr:oxidoreductase, Gfo/Idh/MocA family domain protein [Burkholderia pseudomallei A79D]
MRPRPPDVSLSHALSVRPTSPTNRSAPIRHATIGIRRRAASEPQRPVSQADRIVHVVNAQDWFDGFRFCRRDVPCARHHAQRPHAARRDRDRAAGARGRRVSGGGRRAGSRRARRAR